MRPLLRALRLAAHLCVSGVAFLWFVLRCRGGALLFTHHPDVDGAGRDVQMGPLTDEVRARRGPLVEVTLVSLEGGLLHNLRVKRRPFVSHAALLLVARLVGLLLRSDGKRARDLTACGLLRALRPATVFLIDESGSGQMLVRGARALGIRTVGIQHGDFQPDNPQYGAAASAVPVDMLCLWSSWFQERLLRISSIYGADNTSVVGRMRYDESRSAAGSTGGGVRVLLVSQARPGFRSDVGPFLEVLRADPRLRLTVQPHPGEGPGAWPAAERSHGTLASAIEVADVVCGVDSSALLEALYFRKPALVLAAGPEASLGYAESGGLELCRTPEELSELCLRLAGGDAGAVEECCARIWGRAGGAPVEGILAAAAPEQQAGGNGLRSAA